MVTEITLPRPDDWHVHLRSADMMRAVLPYTAQVFGRAIIMPNLKPPIETAKQASNYRNDILQNLNSASFEPLMTCYLTDHTDINDLEAGFKDSIFTAAKLYPAHATTNSAHGVTDIQKIHPVLERMQTIGMPLLIHGEVTDPAIDIFDREKIFIERIMQPLRINFPTLKIVMEHITTKDAAEFVRAQNGAIGATITIHHLMLNRNAMLVGGIRPHLYCLPILKREEHRLALRRAATGGETMFFLGTDTAPHLQHDKESACGCAGVFSAPVALPLYAQVFEEENALQNLEGFASRNGPAFYGLPVSTKTVTLTKEDWTVPQSISVTATESVIPFMAGERLCWKVKENA